MSAQTSEIVEEFVALGKIPWEKRARLIRERFPNVDNFNWSAALSDMELFGRIIRDILKLEQAVPGRPGPRPSLDVPSATRRLQQLFGDDFSILPFTEAFKVLAGKRSIRQLSRLTGIGRTALHDLMTGKDEPDGFELRKCAEAFGKHPSYFLEWRILYVTQAITQRLEWSPEASIGLYKALDQQRKAK